MFCPECGTKNEKGSMFCEKCGTKLEGSAPKKAQPKKQTTTSKPMSKKTIILIVAISCAVVLLCSVYGVLASKTKPENIVKNYMKARTTNDYSKMYDYMVDVQEGDKTFVSKEAFVNIGKQEESSKIQNYKVGKRVYSLGKLTSTVVVNYTEEGTTGSKEMVITLKKSNKKAYLLFNKWIITDSYSDSSLIKDFEITVPKGAKVVYAGINVDSKYLSKEKSTETNDVYVLSQVFAATTPIKVTTSNGIESETTVKPSSYTTSYKFELTIDNISEKLKSSIEKQSMTDMNDIFKGTIDGTEFEKLTNKNFDSKLKTSYDSYKTSISGLSYKLTSLNVTKSSVTRLYNNNDGTVQFRITISYDYSLITTSNGSEKTVSKNSTDYVYLTYDLSGKTYKLVKVESLPTYFSRY